MMTTIAMVRAVVSRRFVLRRLFVVDFSSKVFSPYVIES